MTKHEYGDKTVRPSLTGTAVTMSNHENDDSISEDSLISMTKQVYADKKGRPSLTGTSVTMSNQETDDFITDDSLTIMTKQVYADKKGRPMTNQETDDFITDDSLIINDLNHHKDRSRSSTTITKSTVRFAPQVEPEVDYDSDLNDDSKICKKALYLGELGVDDSNGAFGKRPKHPSEARPLNILRRSTFIRRKQKIQAIHRNEDSSRYTALYPQDCYSLISLNGPESTFFWFGLMVFAFQIAFLVMIGATVFDDRWSSIGDDDNPWMDRHRLAGIIDTEVTPVVRGAQFLSLAASFIFVDSSVMDVITAVTIFPRYSLATSRDRVYCMTFSCILRGMQGLLAVIVSLVLALNSNNAIEIIINFTALNFISALDNVAFEFAQSGHYGPNLDEEIKVIEDKKLPVCMFRDSSTKHLCYYYTVIPLAILIFGMFFGVVYVQEHPKIWESHALRVQFGEDSGLSEYNGCYHNDFERKDSWRRDFYTNKKTNARFGYCIDTHKWYLYDGTNTDVCGEEPIVESQYSNSFGIHSSFFDNWYTTDNKQADLYFFHNTTEYDDKYLHCDDFLNDGICDDAFNTKFNNFDEGDCCAATCNHANCGTGGLTNAFGSIKTTGDGFSNCRDPTMKPMTIQLNNFKSSRSPESMELSKAQEEYTAVFWPSFREEDPIDALLTMICDDAIVLKFYVDNSMENQTETMKVSDGANCEIKITNSTSFDKKWSSDPIWYVDYTVYDGEMTEDPSQILHESSDNVGVSSFKFVPECYLRKLGENIDRTTVYNAVEPSSKAIDWMRRDQSEDSTNCESENFIERYALSAMNFAAPKMHSSSNVDDQLWIEYGNQCSWQHVACSRSLKTNTSSMILDISGIGISGYIATEIGLLDNIHFFDAHHNDLTGSIPTEIGMLTNAVHINLKGNNLTGSIPSEIGLLTALTRLDIQDNALSGSIPTEIEALSNLVVLDLRSNDLTGSIPSEVGSLTSATVLALGYNAFSGPIPSEIGLLANMTILDFTSNSFTGSIPSEVGLLLSMMFFSVGDNNSLTGSIPTEMEGLSDLQLLSIMDNFLP